MRRYHARPLATFGNNRERGHRLLACRGIAVRSALDLPVVPARPRPGAALRGSAIGPGPNALRPHVTLTLRRAHIAYRDWTAWLGM
jgi:hypothetical protein